MAAAGRVRWNIAAIEALINSPLGGTARLLDRQAQVIENIAKLNASVSDGVPPSRRSFAPGLRAQYGLGRSSITHEIGVDTAGVYARVGTNVFYMAIHELQGRYTWLVPALEAAGSH